MANALYQSKLIAGAFFVISHSEFIFVKLLFSLGKCSFWLISWQFFPSALKITKFTNFHRPHSVFTDFQGLEKHIPFFPNFQRLCEPCSASLCTYHTSCNYFWSSCEKVLKIPKHNLTSFGQYSFSFIAPSVWNLLPASLQNVPTVWIQNPAQDFPV